MKVPLLDLKLEYRFLKKEIDKNLKSCLNSQKWILGPLVSEFEKKVADYLGVKYALGVASGTDALLIGLGALSLSLQKEEIFNSKDEIITTPFTFIATGEAIIRAGARPVFVDIEADSFNIDPSAVSKAINKNTRGIIPVHLYGNACKMKKIRKIANDNNLFVLEDCAQSFGATYSALAVKEKKTGTLGQVGAFSFFPSKNLGCFGDGGLITTGKKRIADLIKVLRNHGQVSQYKSHYCGYNSRLDSIQAAVLLAKLKHIDSFNQKRIKIAQAYGQAFGAIAQIRTPAPSFGHIYHLYTIKVPAKMRTKLVKHLNSKGIAARSYYPVGLDQMPAFQRAKVPYSLKNTKKAAQEVISLPIYPLMDKKKLEYVIKNVAKGVSLFSLA